MSIYVHLLKNNAVKYYLWQKLYVAVRNKKIVSLKPDDRFKFLNI